MSSLSRPGYRACGTAESVAVGSADRAADVVVVCTVAVIVGMAAVVLRIGSDAQWLAALGDRIISIHAIPAGVPFAAAPSGHWSNPIVLAELIFAGLEAAFGDRGLMVAQLLAATGGLFVVARDARAEGASARQSSAALLMVAAGAMGALVIARAQLFSLAAFPVLAMLLRSEARRPSSRIWLALPLLAVWSNLHGGALTGLALTLAYLWLARLRQQPGLAILLSVLAPAALLLTPALLSTIGYYHGVLTNVAAQRGEGMWGPLSLNSPIDLLTIVSALALAWRLPRSRPALWEWAAAAALALFTVQASRSGVWLLMFIAPAAARGMAPSGRWERLALPCAMVAAVAGAIGIAHGPVADIPSQALMRRALEIAHGTPVLASDQIAERLALDGGRVWISDPIDAFSRDDQAAYLDWLAGDRTGLAALVPQVDTVLVLRATPAAGLMRQAPGFVEVAMDPMATLYSRSPRGSASGPGKLRSHGPPASRSFAP